MPAIHLLLDGDNAWPDLRDPDRVIHLGSGSPPIGIAVLANGMASGKPSVCLRVDLPDGRSVLAETSMALFVAAARAMVARYGEPS